MSVLNYSAQLKPNDKKLKVKKILQNQVFSFKNEENVTFFILKKIKENVHSLLGSIS